MAKQFVAVRFRPNDPRTYTYANDGEPVRVGDRVKVPDARFGGWKPVEVVELVEEPRFECKSILGLVDGDTIDERLLSASEAEPHKPSLAPDLFGGGNG